MTTRIASNRRRASRALRTRAAAVARRVTGIGGLVLMYHRIAEPVGAHDTMCVSPARFEEQMAQLRRSWEPVSAASLVRPLRPRTRRMVAITFDDGYADNATVARPILDRFEIPATFFVTTSAIGTSTEFWWDELDRLIGNRDGPAIRVHLGDGSACDVGGTADPDLARRTISNRLRTLTRRDLDSELDVLAAQLGRSRSARTDFLPMTVEQLVELASSGLHEVGNHTRNHRPLPLLEPIEQRRELDEAQADLVVWTGRRARLFAYPGGHRSPSAQDVVMAAGFDAAFGTEFAVVDRTNVAAIGRFMVRDVDGDQFAARLRRWA